MNNWTIIRFMLSPQQTMLGERYTRNESC